MNAGTSISISLLPIILLAVMLGGLIALIIRLRFARRVETPSCPNCWYSAVGLPSPICPECGTNLDESGIVQPGDRRPVSRFVWLLFWTSFMPFPAWVASSVIIARVPYQMVFMQTTTLSAPGSGQFQSIVMQSPASGVMPALPSGQDLGITVTLSDGTSHQMITDPYEEVLHYSTSKGEDIEVEGPITPGTLEAWLSDLGVNVDEAVRYELDQVMQNKITTTQQGAGAGVRMFGSSGSAGRFTTGRISAGFASVSSRSGSQMASRDHLRRNAAIIAAIVWAAGVAVILLWPRTRPRA